MVMNRINEITELRHALHKTPELSGKERITAKKILNFLKLYKPDKIYKSIYGYALAAEYIGQENGPTLLFRCDMDAVPVEESSQIEYRSLKPNISHTCGHDGHIAMVSGLAICLKERPIKKGRVILFYQPSEENGEGAKGSVEGLKRLGIVPDYAFAIHNLPGYPKNSVIFGKYTFSAASMGLAIKLRGKTSHAAYPENGINPSPALSEIMQYIFNFDKSVFSDYVLATIVRIEMGNRTFGISPGDAEMFVTLRAFNNVDMEKFSSTIIAAISGISGKHRLELDYYFSDVFPASDCNSELTEMVAQISNIKGFNTIYLHEPNRWSEDFAHFTINFPSIIFGIGSGLDHPQLHTSSYDFPDDILETGVKIMDTVVDEMLR